MEQLLPPPGAQIIDADGMILSPGFIDVQLNGAFGHGFTADPASIWPAAALLPRYGVTAFLPTLVTSPLETVAAAQAVLTPGPPTEFSGATPLGLHVESSFLNPMKKGAHNQAYLRYPDLAAVADWSPKEGVRLVTMAPELPGALEVISVLMERGVVVSAGHSNATFAEAQAGIEAGIRYGTHLFNAMPGLHHREPGLIGALLADSRVTLGLIPDGIHVHPAVVNLAWQALGSARLNLVTDATASLGMPAGRYRFGPQEVFVDEASARLADGTLAGSILSLDAALRNLMSFAGCSLEEALPTITSTPAELLGLSDQKGRLEPGLSADLVLLTRDLKVAMTIVDGKAVYTHER
jgi:N-acetylglucosamine-6-phosphate deacetylase